MSINDEKKREVASKLRSEAEGWRDLFPDATPEGEGIDAAIMFDLIRFIGLDDESPVHAIYARLADLIEPQMIDRDELLDIAEDLDCGWAQFNDYTVSCEDVDKFEQEIASRIRKAVGE